MQNRRIFSKPCTIEVVCVQTYEQGEVWNKFSTVETLHSLVCWKGKKILICTLAISCMVLNIYNMLT